MPTIDALANRLNEYLDTDQINLVRRAYYYAEQAHDGQSRRSGEPYITHPLAVANILAEMHMDHQSLMAAMLHDVIEDTAIAKNHIDKQFGGTVADLVDGVSKLTHLEFETKAEEQAENFQKMALAMAQDIRVILVKLSDRLHNMRTLGPLRPEKRRRIARETLDIYAPIALRLGLNDFRIELEDLCMRAIHPMRAERIESAINQRRGNRKQLVARIEQALSDHLMAESLPGRVMGREKHLASIYNKMKEQGKSLSEILDVYAFRIVTNSVDSCYRILGSVHNFYKPMPNRFKDYIAIPKVNGYQSLHTTLIGMNGVPIEVQIRTEDMEEMANNGIAAHWLYKTNEGDDASIPQSRARMWVQGLLEMQNQAGNPLEFIENVKIDLFPDEIYVFTPKGKIMELPKGATAVDFAYAVHTDVGNACVGCMINKKVAPLSRPLESGDSIKIITAPGAHPNGAWLSFVVTGKARSAIRHYLKNRRRNDSEELGRRLLDKALQDFNTSIDQLDEDLIADYLAEDEAENLSGLLEEIGLGHRMAYLVARRLVNPEAEQVHAEDAMTIGGNEGMVLSYAKCCRPIPGDPIVGVISAGKGMVIHYDGCRNISDLKEDQDRLIHLKWDKELHGEFLVELRVEVKNQRGVIAKIASAIALADASIESINVLEKDASTGQIQLTIAVSGRLHLSDVMKRVRKMKELIKVSRVRG